MKGSESWAAVKRHFLFSLGLGVFKMTSAFLPEAPTVVITPFIKYGLKEKYMFGKPRKLAKLRINRILGFGETFGYRQ